MQSRCIEADDLAGYLGRDIDSSVSRRDFESWLSKLRAV